MPFIVKGVEYDPEDIVRFNGKELLFILTSRSGSPEMVVIEDKSVWSSFLQTQMIVNLVTTNWDALEGQQYGGYTTHPAEGPVIIVTPPRPGQGSSGGGSSLTASVRMYSDADLKGSMIELGPDRVYSDLTSQYIFSPFDDWNDEISSFSGTASFCVYGEHIHFDPGSKLVLQLRGLGHHNLEELGWNDRISSVWNMGSAF